MIKRIFILLVLISKTVFCQDLERFQGITEPFSDSTLGAMVDGTVSVIKRQEGEFVRKGEIILELENSQEILEVKRRRIISESKVELNSAEKRKELLKFDYEGTLSLFNSTKSVSEEELRKKELEFKLAEAEYEQALVAEEREKLEYGIAQQQLEKRYVKAPFDCVIVKIFFSPGENCDTQQPLVRVVAADKCRFIAHIDAPEAAAFKKGMKVVLGFDIIPDLVEGVVDYVSPVVDPSSGLQEVKVLFDNRDNIVAPGITGYISTAGGR